jgi:serine/threonine-protein kinase HipA
MAKQTQLDIVMNGLRVGLWQPQKGTFKYYDDWCASEYARSLSLSMPIAPGSTVYRGDVVQNYFDNLLPDADVMRRRLALKFKANSSNTADLLGAVGRDCVGAIQIIPSAEDIPADEGLVGSPLDDAQVAQILRNTTSDKPMNLQGNDDGLRLSIAGAQEKNALLQHNGKWFLPVGATPTTHILKLPLGLVGNMAADMSASVENEWLCSRIVHHFNLPVAECKPMIFFDDIGPVKALVVERFDRQLDTDAGRMLRLPQEDMCQVFGINSLYKYEQDGGPTAKMIISKLRFGSNADEDCRNFFKTLVVFWLMAATDGHAKNFSIHLLRQGKYKLTPLYDVLSAYPVIGPKARQIPRQKVKLAMAVESKHRHYHAFMILARQWIEFGKKLGLPDFVVLDVLTETHAQVDKVINMVTQELPADFPPLVSESIFAGMVAMNKKLAAFQ